MTSRTILVTGGSGYIASHVVLELIKDGYKPVILDNFSNSSPGVIKRLETLAGQAIHVVEVDCRDAEKMRSTFQEHDIFGVMHFAGLKAVGESIADPLAYYDHNVSGFVTTLRAAHAAKVETFIFSSSATVYAPSDEALICENAPVGPINPYGQSKLMCEIILKDFCKSAPNARAVIMRYFNPVGAHPSGDIGEAPNQTPNNLLPFIDRVASKKMNKLVIFGDDYDTPDGTGIRDYIHVMDLARGHVQALNFLQNNNGAHVFNLGSGTGTSVLELVDIYKRTNACDVPYTIGPRRAGDQGRVVADASKAKSVLGFDCYYTQEQACKHSCDWQVKNPTGYT